MDFFPIFVPFQFLYRANSYETDGIAVRNCTAHNSIGIIPGLLYVNVLFLPKNTTSRLHSFEAGIIASIRKRYRHRQV